MSDSKKTIKLFFGGDVNLGRGLNRYADMMEPFVGINEMVAADVRLVNLECVIATQGEQRAVINTFYLRARPEQTNILTKADIDIVLTANNHTGDYGKAALLEQKNYLDAAGILQAGSGKNFDEAFTPAYKKVGDIILAIFSIDSTRKSTAATATEAGTAYLPPNDIELWKKVLADKIREAHEKADVVLVAPHWGVNSVTKPSQQLKRLGKLLIDLGADAVLGTHAHHFHGVENYKGRPIIYDAGDFLFDSKKRGVGCFTLDISSDGVDKVNFIPLVKTPGQTLRARKSAPAIQREFVRRCKEFKTSTSLAEDTVEINFTPPPREHKPLKISDEIILTEHRPKKLIEPLSEPRPEWTVDKVPEEAIITPQKFGALKLVGYYVPPECRVMKQIKMLYVETYWTIDEPVEGDYRLIIRGEPVRECEMPPYGAGQGHQFLDWMWPVNRWKPGVIYREKFALLAPPAKFRDKMANIDLQVKIKVRIGDELIEGFKDPKLIEMNIPDLGYSRYNLDFDDIIYQSEPGKCWNAEQLAKVTGGEWIVPPPKGWYVNSFSRRDALIGTLYPRPTIFVANMIKGRDSHPRILENIDNLDGAIISHDVEGLPPNFPLLKVENSSRALYEIGFAARKRFQGKVIAVTGSAGKTTTCNMLDCVLSPEHVTKSGRGTNLYQTIPWVFSNVRQEYAFAVIEMALSAFIRPRGSITYEITPNVAVVTSLAPAHVGYKACGTLEAVAEYKSKIFCGMTAGSYAVLNRDMPHYEIFAEKAKSFNLNIITFGKHAESTVRMPVIVDGGEFFVMGNTYKLQCPVPADQIYDALAVVAVSVAVGFSVEKTLEHLKNFSPLSGRGNIVKSTRNGKRLTIIDSAFNANPLSMKGALEHLKTVAPNQKSRVAILGDMAELGDETVKYHRQLAKIILAVKPDRLLLCGELMRHPYALVKDKLNCTWFETLDKLLAGVENHLQDGDTILIKSSHDTGLSKVVDLLSKDTAPAVIKTSAELNIPKSLFDVENFLPEGITSAQNGLMPADRLKKIHCGGHLYIDAARAWLAMVRAAMQDKIFLNVNMPFNAYRNIKHQINVFQQRFVPIDAQDNSDAIKVPYDGKIWQLKPDAIYAAIPGTSSHGYGLAVDILNSGNAKIKSWLNQNAADFGFVREYDFEPWHFTYIRSREGLSERVLEIENLPPEPTFSAEEIAQVSGGKWIISPPEDWTCNGIFSTRPVKVNHLAAVDQGEGVGISEKIVGKVFRQLAGLICTNPEPLMKYNLPILAVSNLNDALEKISCCKSK